MVIFLSGICLRKVLFPRVPAVILQIYLRKQGLLNQPFAASKPWPGAAQPGWVGEQSSSPSSAQPGWVGELCPGSGSAQPGWVGLTGAAQSYCCLPRTPHQQRKDGDQHPLLPQPLWHFLSSSLLLCRRKWVSKLCS